MSTYDKWLAVFIDESYISKDLSFIMQLAICVMLFAMLCKLITHCFNIRIEKFEDYYNDESRFLITDSFSKKQKLTSRFVNVDETKRADTRSEFDTTSELEVSSV